LASGKTESNVTQVTIVWSKQMKQENNMGPTEWLLLVILSVLWGGSFLFNGVAVKQLPPLTVVALRVSLAAVFLNLVARFRGTRVREVWRHIVPFLVMGILNNVIPFSLIVWGQRQIASSLASILNATTPIFTIIIAHLFTKDEKITATKVIGICAGFIGVVVIIGFDIAKEIGINVVAQIAILGAACSYGFAGVYGKRFRSTGVPAISVAAGQVSMSAILLIPLSLSVDKPWKLPSPSIETYLAIAGLAILSTGVAYVIYFRILSTAGATNLLLVTFLIPASAFFFGTLLLNEHLPPRYILGLGIICLGLMAIDGRVFRLLRRRWPTRN
jgi:drug/metabolite transporter (DMT)-like permease